MDRVSFDRRRRARRGQAVFFGKFREPQPSPYQLHQQRFVVSVNRLRCRRGTARCTGAVLYCCQHLAPSPTSAIVQLSKTVRRGEGSYGESRKSASREPEVNHGRETKCNRSRGERVKRQINGPVTHADTQCITAGLSSI